MAENKFYIESDPRGYFDALAGLTQDFIVVLDPVEYTLMYINHILPGFKMEDVIGASVFSFIEPDHHQLYKDKLEKVVRVRKSETMELVGKSTLYEDGKAWYFSTMSPILRQDNEIESILLVSKDITAQKKSEMELANTYYHLHSIINNTKDLIVSIDENYNINEYNKTFELMVQRGFSAANVIGENILRFIDSSKHDRLKEIYRKVLIGETINDIESFSGPSGKTVFNETSYNPISSADGKIIGISIFSKDITDRVMNEQILINSLKEREMLLFEIHHRIKNNLALITSMLELKEMNLADMEAKEALKESRERIKLTALVHERLYSNADFNEISMNAYLIELFNYIRKNEEQQIIIEGDLIQMDLKRAFPFGLLMHEMMMNSIKHSFKDGQENDIQISVGKEQDYIDIIYKDKHGSFPENINFNSSISTGLMLINTFIEQMNGKITKINNTPPAFKIEIPINEG